MVHTKKQACVYISTVYFLVFVILMAGLLFGASAAASWSIAPVSMVFVFVVAFCCSGKCLPETEVVKEKHEAVPKRPRKYWLDNAKIFLTSMVVIGHSGMPFMGQAATIGFSVAETASWFLPIGLSALTLLKPLIVPLFYFISGFFSRSSLNKKGPTGFLRESFKRLGTIYFLFWLIINPMMQFASFTLASPSNASFTYFPSSPHTWFLSWLLVFQCCYAMTASSATSTTSALVDKKHLPSFGRLVCSMLVLSLIQLVPSMICLVAGSPLFGEMPMAGPGGDGFFNAFGFVAGAYAQGNGWLDSPIPENLARYSCRYVFFFTAFVPILFILISSPVGIGISQEGFMVVFFALQFPSGVYCGCVLIAAIDYFMRKCDRANSLSRFLARGAFLVYLLHYWFVTLYTFSFTKILDSTGDTEITFTNSTQSDTIISDGQRVGGFLYVSGLSVLTTFIIGGLLSRFIKL